MKNKTLKELELEHIYKTLVYCDWDRSEVYKILGISSRGLRNKIKELRDNGYQTETINDKRTNIQKIEKEDALLGKEAWCQGR